VEKKKGERIAPSKSNRGGEGEKGGESPSSFPRGKRKPRGGCAHTSEGGGDVQEKEENPHQDLARYRAREGAQKKYGKEEIDTFPYLRKKREKKILSTLGEEKALPEGGGKNVETPQ